MKDSSIVVRKMVLAMTLASGLTLGGCGKHESAAVGVDSGSIPATAAPATGSSVTPAATNLERYCSLVSATMINAALGTSLSGPKTRIQNDIVTCTFDSPPVAFDPKNPQASMQRQPFAFVRYHTNVGKAGWSGLKLGARLAPGVGLEASDLAGLGDDAAVNSVQANKVVVENDVQVFVERARVAFQVGSMAPLAKEADLARKIVPML